MSDAASQAAAPEWKNYEGRTADFYRSLGLDARLGETLEGARGSHDIDVTVRGTRAGVQFLWVVECKKWQRAVPKEKVAALSAIIQDVGADRGILLSESGFQSGAISLARHSNISLTNLSELRLHSQPEYVQHQNNVLMRRCDHLLSELDSIWPTVDEQHIYLRHFDCPSGKGYWRSQISALHDTISSTVRDEWPVSVFVRNSAGHFSFTDAQDYTDFLSLIGWALSQLEAEIRSVKSGITTCLCS